MKDFCDAVMENMKETDVGDIYFSRVVSDQFILFQPVGEVSALVEKVERVNREFCRHQMLWHPRDPGPGAQRYLCDRRQLRERFGGH